MARLTVHTLEMQRLLVVVGFNFYSPARGVNEHGCMVGDLVGGGGVTGWGYYYACYGGDNIQVSSCG